MNGRTSSVVSRRRQVLDDLSPFLEHLLDFGHRRLESRNGKLAGAPRAKTRVNFTSVILAIVINLDKEAMFFAGIFEKSASTFFVPQCRFEFAEVRVELVPTNAERFGLRDVAVGGGEEGVVAVGQLLGLGIKFVGLQSRLQNSQLDRKLIFRPPCRRML